jgi:hypothetical protein
MPAYKDIIIHSWDGPDDPENPFNWGVKYKWLLTITVCFMYVKPTLPNAKAPITDIPPQLYLDRSPSRNIWLRK